MLSHDGRADRHKRAFLAGLEIFSLTLYFVVKYFLYSGLAVIFHFNYIHKKMQNKTVVANICSGGSGESNVEQSRLVYAVH